MGDGLDTGSAGLIADEHAPPAGTVPKSGHVHRDIKPGNILVAADGRWILTDLGIALETEAERLTGSELLLSRD
jgi:serine/threonine protein kinase